MDLRSPWRRPLTSLLVGLAMVAGANPVPDAASIAAAAGPPTAPAGLASSDLTCRTVTLSWTAAADDVGVTAYDVYHDGQLVTSVSGATLKVTLDVVPGATWGWYVNARDADGNVSQASETVSTTAPHCQADPEAPTTPTAVTGTASGNSVTLRWVAATDNTGVTTYVITRNGTTAGTVAGSASTPPATTFTDNGLRTDTSYRYAVLARDAQVPAQQG
jgi:hypothetical protein